MNNKEAIEHLNQVVRSLSEVFWLFDSACEEIRSNPADKSSRERISSILIEHLKSAIEDIHDVQSFLLFARDINSPDLDESQVLDDFMSSRANI